MGLPRALALGYLVKNLPDQGNIVVSSRHHCRASRAASGHLYGLVEWKMLSASLASSFHLEFGRLVPLLDASPPMPRVGFALRCARAWERAQRSTLSGVGELVARREALGRAGREQKITLVGHGRKPTERNPAPAAPSLIRTMEVAPF